MWRAFQDESVRVVGGRTLARFQPVTDPAVLQRLADKARGAVRQIDLRALGHYRVWHDAVARVRPADNARRIANCSATASR